MVFVFLQLIDVSGNKELMKYYSSVLTTTLLQQRTRVIVTKLFVQLWSRLQKVLGTTAANQGGGDIGRGTYGNRKNYIPFLHSKLIRIPNCLPLIISAAMFLNKERCLPYLVSFCEGTLLRVLLQKYLTLSAPVD